MKDDWELEWDYPHWEDIREAINEYWRLKALPALVIERIETTRRSARDIHTETTVSPNFGDKRW